MRQRRVRELRLVRIVLVMSAVHLCGAFCGSQTSPSALRAKVDERVELLSIVFHLAGNPEYNMGRLDGYTGEIDRYFGPYKQHAAVVLAKRSSVTEPRMTLLRQT